MMSTSIAKSKSANKAKNPKSLIDKIIHAIRNQPAPGNYVSQVSIAKYLESEFQVDKSKSSQLKNAFKKGVESGKLEQKGQSFRVAGDPVREIPAELKVKCEDIKKGSGPGADVGDTVVVKYEGKLDDGSVFDSGSKFEFVLGAGEVIKGWDEGILSMKKGGVRKLFIPSKLGYGKRGSPPEIPPNADLHFTVSLKEIR
mmetsp:Transcript_6504/g.13334  ORF Transcript_6504/g.13334 Transcript_6504/m.13334 type:complete len:199 (-) Transcript_6504:2789-3385(-)